MKAQSITIKNIGLITEETIVIDQPLICFYGEIKQGKTTILNCFKWVCGGAFPDDIIQHGKDEASIDFKFDNAMISRSFYRSKPHAETGARVTKARDVIFIRDGKPVSNPVSEIRRLLNPFLLDQDFLKKMGDTDRKRWFGEFFAIDTSALDQEYVVVDRDAKSLRSKLSGYGEINLTPVATVDPAQLKTQLSEIRRKHQDHIALVEEKNQQVRNHNAFIRNAKTTIETLNSEIGELDEKLKQAKAHRDLELKSIEKMTEETLAPAPVAPDTSELETQISEAAAQNVRAEQYKKDKERADAKAKDHAELSKKEARLREIKAQKIAKLESITKDCKIKGLTFDSDGNFRYEDTDSGMLSTSQLMKLSSELSALYPEGFGLELIDRGESLGRSIFEFVDRAKADDLCILATIVGESPATVPADVGVFVVEKGKVKGTKATKKVTKVTEPATEPVKPATNEAKPATEGLL